MKTGQNNKTAIFAMALGVMLFSNSGLADTLNVKIQRAAVGQEDGQNVLVTVDNFDNPRHSVTRVTEEVAHELVDPNMDPSKLSDAAKQKVKDLFVKPEDLLAAIAEAKKFKEENEAEAAAAGAEPIARPPHLIDYDGSGGFDGLGGIDGYGDYGSSGSVEMMGISGSDLEIRNNYVNVAPLADNLAAEAATK